ncbi:TldD/PmbA family protein [Candidatus Micrarchaeota archaeon]|nr:TldD/PmbA family protein [Candidatus Micrarchaeota archaeon]
MLDVEQVVSLALKLGADEAEAFRSSGKSFSFSSVKDKIHSKEFDEETGFGVRVLKQKGLGFSFFSREQDAEKAVRNALALADYSEKTSFHFPKKQKTVKTNCFDKRVSALSEEDGKKMLLELINSVKEKANSIECRVSFSSSKAEIANCAGLHASEQYSDFSASAEAESNGKTGHESAGSCFLDLNVREIGAQAGARAKDAGKAVKAKPGAREIIFDVQAVYSFISELLFPSFNGNTVRRGSSFLCGKLGKQIACRQFSLHDDPLAQALDICSFDGEGIASKRKTLVEKGVLKNFLFDSKTLAASGELKRELNASPGNCARAGFDSAPGIGHSNLVIDSGSSGDLVRECKRGLCVTSFFGTHTANTTTGDFTVSVDCGYEIENGALSTPVLGAMISGNVFTLLEQISGIEKKQERFYDLISPRVAFKKMSVSA